MCTLVIIYYGSLKKQYKRFNAYNITVRISNKIENGMKNIISFT